MIDFLMTGVFLMCAGIGYIAINRLGGFLQKIDDLREERRNSCENSGVCYNHHKRDEVKESECKKAG